MEETKKMGRGEKFVSYIISLIASNTAKAAALRRADNPALEYQSWEILNRFGIDLTRDQERSIYCLVAASIAKAKITEDGFQNIGKAIANCYEGKSANDQAMAKVRRLIACTSIEELCSVLRPLLQFIQSKNGANLSYARLLDELLMFQWHTIDIKAIWAQNFYSQTSNEEAENVC